MAAMTAFRTSPAVPWLGFLSGHPPDHSIPEPQVPGRTSPRKDTEEALRTSEQQWRDVFENNPTMYFMVDAAGLVMAVNPFGAEQLGYKSDELVGQAVLCVK